MLALLVYADSDLKMSHAALLQGRAATITANALSKAHMALMIVDAR